ncbi:MAG: hypothetical protein A3I66_02825 [Burkholderiales bacterium RIFCSPLOWO2_02_FULL_57_36]|nr:MAG: hypothetical protein A3I66_02825 [Burkholderiales bacterium RIFCSPLOWO2_02_FULL_57_36]
MLAIGCLLHQVLPTASTLQFEQSLTDLVDGYMYQLARCKNQGQVKGRADGLGKRVRHVFQGGRSGAELIAE